LNAATDVPPVGVAAVPVALVAVPVAVLLVALVGVELAAVLAGALAAALVGVLLCLLLEPHAVSARAHNATAAIVERRVIDCLLPVGSEVALCAIPPASRVAVGSSLNRT
jgi:hypothetical protein